MIYRWSSFPQQSFLAASSIRSMVTLPWKPASLEIPRAHASEVAATLPGVELKGLLIIPTSQNSQQDLVRVGESIEQEKDELLEKPQLQFMQFATTVCDHLIAGGFWADYLDPCSGLTMVHRANGSVYSEVDAFSTLLGYQTANAGCCKVLLHPEWGSYVYPASMFAKAPLAEVRAAITAADGALRTTKAQKP